MSDIPSTRVTVADDHAINEHECNGDAAIERIVASLAGAIAESEQPLLLAPPSHISGVPDLVTSNSNGSFKSLPTFPDPLPPKKCRASPTPAGPSKSQRQSESMTIASRPSFIVSTLSLIILLLCITHICFFMQNRHLSATLSDVQHHQDELERQIQISKAVAAQQQSDYEVERKSSSDRAAEALHEIAKRPKANGRYLSYGNPKGEFPLMHFTIVFNVYLYRNMSWWGPIVKQQLNELHTFGLTNASSLSLHVVLVSDQTDNFDNAGVTNLDQGERMVRSIHPTAIVWRVLGNRYEFAGLDLLWRLIHVEAENERPAHVPPAFHLCLYFHTKGMVYRYMAVEQSKTRRTRLNRLMTDSVVKTWREVATRFQQDLDVTAAGWCPSKDGFIWYNFIWARATYLEMVERPSLETDRFQYEYWLGEVIKTPANSYMQGSKNMLALCQAQGNEGSILERRLGFTDLKHCFIPPGYREEDPDLPVNTIQR